MPTLTETRWEYFIVPLQKAKGIKRGSEPWEPERLNDLGAEG